MLKSLFLFAILSNYASAQISGTSIEISTGVLGGSYYDVPSKYKMDKYGAERLSPKGISFSGKIDSDKYGNLFFRTLSAHRVEDKTQLGKQTLFTYETPKVFLGEKENLKLFVKGDLLHYSQKDHFIYFKIDDDSVPDLEKNLEMEKHIRVDQSQTYSGALIGTCIQKDYQVKDFDFSGFAELSLMPVGLMNYTYQQVNGDKKSGSALATGGEIAVSGIAKYKGKYYLKAKISQTMTMGFSTDKPSIQNRIGHYELGYIINKNLSANFSVENNELVVLNKDRRAIDVYNIVGVGMQWKIPYKK